MNPDEMLLLEWLNKNGKSLHAIWELKNSIILGKAWLSRFRQWSSEGIEGATAALNAAERLYAKSGK